MERIDVQTAHNVAIEFEVAGLGDRLIAALIDYLILFCYFIGAVLLLGVADAPMAAFVLAYLPVFLYFLLCEVLMEGQSIGKRLRRLKVAKVDGTAPTLGSYLLRWLLRPIDVELFAGLVGVLTLLINGRGQRLGDLAAGTTVVRLRDDARLADTLFTRLDDAYTPTFAQAEHLADEDVMTAKEVLNTLVAEGRTRTAYQLGNKMKATLEQKMGVRSDLPPADFLRTVVRDYNHLNGRV